MGNNLQAAASGPTAAPVPSHDTQVIQVLTTAAQRVAQEAQSQVVAGGGGIPVEMGSEFQSLAKQQHVLTVTAQAVDKTVAASGSIAAQPTNMLATAAQQVVIQAARQVAADHSAIVAAQISAGLSPHSTTTGQVTVNEVSVATQTAVAQAVEITGPLSSEVDVLMTASSLLQHQTRAPPTSTAAASVVMPSVDSLRSHSTSTLLPRASSFSASLPSVSETSLFPSHIPPLPPVDLTAFSNQ
jgi:hypothetical protein